MPSDIKSATVQFDWPLVQGNFDVTIPGLGWTPKAIKITIGGGAVNETNVNNARYGIGFATATDQRATCSTILDTVTPTDTLRTQRNDAVAVTTNGGSIQRLLSVGPIADGWQLNSFELQSNDLKCTVEFYGGADLQVDVGTWTPEASSAIEHIQPGVPFQPNYLEVAAIGYSSTNVNAGHAILSTGAAYDNGVTIEQGTLIIASVDSGTTSRAGISLREGVVTGQVTWTSTSWVRPITEFTPTGWKSLGGFGTTGGDSTYYMAMNIGDRKAAVKVIDSPTSSVDDWDVTGIGFKPQSVSIGSTILDSTNLPQDFTTRAGYIGLGASDSVRSSSVASNTEDEVLAIDSNAVSVTSAKLVHMTTVDGTVLFDVGQPIFNDDGWTVPASEIGVALGDARKWLVVALEANEVWGNDEYYKTLLSGNTL